MLDADGRHFIKVQFATHKVTGLMIATSEDLRGLYVHGRTEEELEQNIPLAIQAIMEETTGQKGSVSKVTAESSPFKSNVIEYELVEE